MENSVGSNPSGNSPSPATSITKLDADGNTVLTHKRTYQACIPCRRRKVRCDLGPVDNPNEPPCVRCRRESKECYFSATRRKRRADSGEDIGGEKAVDDDYALYNRRRKTSHGQDVGLSHGQASANHMSQSPISQDESYDWRQDRTQQGGMYDENNTPGRANTPGDQEVTNEAAAALFQSPINQPADALHLLLEASGRTGDLHRQASISHGDQKRNISARDAPKASTGSHGSNTRKPINGPEHRDQKLNIDPAIADETGNANEDDSSRFQEALRIWSRLRFVRAGWFTAREAMSYIDYYYDYLAPLTPVVIPEFRHLYTVPTLLREEPLLTVTLLTISSRYKKLPGPGGQSRSFMIHDRLWGRLQNMISRMFFSQESFGSGVNGNGSCATDQGRLRTLGTIESLLLLSEFHPRSMHFPPGDDGDEILTPTDADTDHLLSEEDEAQKGLTDGQANFTAWTEPALRSDRLCWSLVGAAHSLAHEMGLFGSFADSTLTTGLRAQRLERLVYVYVSQTSGRLGLPTMIRGGSQESDFRHLQQTLLQQNAQDPQDIDGAILSCWMGITSFMGVSNLRVFPSKNRTMNLIRSGEYLGFLHEAQPILQGWWANFESLDLPKYPRIILAIEFEYAPLQAILDQWGSSGSLAQAQHLSSLYWKNEVHVKEVVSASRNLLRHVVDGLLPDDYLKHVPVRTFFRVLSGAMFLLKSFALGAKENEVKTSLDLLDRTVQALRTSVVDDVHLCLRIADLLEGLTTSVRHKFVRIAGRSTGKATQQVATPSSDSTRSLYPTLQRPEASIRQDGTQTSNDLSTRNISIMPPPNSAYSLNNYAFSPASQASPAPFLPNQQQLYSNDSLANLSTSADDWLTLDLNPLLDNSAYSGVDNPWFGNFGPEINSNLDVLGRLVNDGFKEGDFEGGEMGF